MSRRLKIIIHVTFWLFSMATNFILWDLPFFDKNDFLASLIYRIPPYTLYILLFYANYSLLVPHFLIKKRYLLFSLGLLILLFNRIVCCTYFWNGHTFPFDKIPEQLTSMTFSYFYAICISTGLRMLEYWIESEKTKKALEKEVKETELLFLKSQMSPHFLFNTLNNIYGLSLKQMPQTADAIAQLKDMMIYFDHFEKGEKITLEKEIIHLKNFIDLNRLRYTNDVNFITDIKAVNKETIIEPMIFLPFIENAFKHGESKTNSSIDISLTHTLDGISFKVKNKLMLNKRKDDVGGIGINNVRRRLELLFPNQHQLVAITNEGFFLVELNIFNQAMYGEV